MRPPVASNGPVILWYSLQVLPLRPALSPRWAKAAAAFAFLAGLASCEKPRIVALTDTEQRRFDATCKDGDCSLEGHAKASPTRPKPDGAEAAFVLRRASRFFSVCDVWKSGSDSVAIHSIDCRLLECQTDADCPPIRGLPRGSCTNHLCIEPSGDLTAEDAGLLCLAGTGTPANTTQQIERFAMGSNCGVPCRVPSVCRQP